MWPQFKVTLDAAASSQSARLVASLVLERIVGLDEVKMVPLGGSTSLADDQIEDHMEGEVVGVGKAGAAGRVTNGPGKGCAVAEGADGVIDMTGDGDEEGIEGGGPGPNRAQPLAAATADKTTGKKRKGQEGVLEQGRVLAGSRLPPQQLGLGSLLGLPTSGKAFTGLGFNTAANGVAGRLLGGNMSGLAVNRPASAMPVGGLHAANVPPAAAAYQAYQRAAAATANPAAAATAITHPEDQFSANVEMVVSEHTVGLAPHSTAGGPPRMVQHHHAGPIDGPAASSFASSGEDGDEEGETGLSGQVKTGLPLPSLQKGFVAGRSTSPPTAQQPAAPASLATMQAAAGELLGLVAQPSRNRFSQPGSFHVSDRGQLQAAPQVTSAPRRLGSDELAAGPAASQLFKPHAQLKSSAVGLGAAVASSSCGVSPLHIKLLSGSKHGRQELEALHELDRKKGLMAAGGTGTPSRPLPASPSAAPASTAKAGIRSAYASAAAAVPQQVPELASVGSNWQQYVRDDAPGRQDVASSMRHMTPLATWGAAASQSAVPQHAGVPVAQLAAQTVNQPNSGSQANPPSKPLLGGSVWGSNNPRQKLALPPMPHNINSLIGGAPGPKGQLPELVPAPPSSAADPSKPPAPAPVHTRNVLPGKENVAPPAPAALSNKQQHHHIGKPAAPAVSALGNRPSGATAVTAPSLVGGDYNPFELLCSQAFAPLQPSATQQAQGGVAATSQPLASSQQPPATCYDLFL